MNSSWAKAILSFCAIFAIGYTVVFTFQNCGRARLGIQDVNSKSVGLDVNNPQDTSPQCEAGKISIGLNSSGLPICVTPINVAGGRLCGQNEYIYFDGGTGAQCIAISDRDPSGTLCPYNQMMVSYTGVQAITCVQMPGATATCPAGQWLRGFDPAGLKVCSGPATGGTPVPTATPATPTPTTSPTATPSMTPGGTTGVPFNVACPVGQYLETVTGGVAICKNILPSVNPMNTCPAGRAIVGMTGANLLCQTTMTIPTSDVLCLGQMFLVDYAGGAVQCQALPTFDYAHYCGDGKYLQSINTTGFVCDNLPSNLVRYNGTCAPGFFLQGFEGGIPKCVATTAAPTYNQQCPRGFYASAIQNGVLICVSHNSGSMLCAPGSQRSCAVANGVGAQTCAPNGLAWGDCVAMTCNTGFELNNMMCVPTTCPPGFTKENGQCVDKTPPVVDFTVLPAPVTESRNPKFVFTVSDIGSGPDTVMCRVDNGQFVNCLANVDFQVPQIGLHKFELVAKDKAGNSTTVTYNWTIVNPPGTCTPGSTTPCVVPNGTGVATCLSTGQGYGACVATTCNTGWVLTAGICLLAPGPTPSPTPTPPLTAWSWVNTNSKESAAVVCARVGGVPAVGHGQNGLGICASDESAPGPGSGDNWDKIVYPNNLRHLTKNITYQQKQGGVIVTKSSSTYYCYKSGQKKDNDKTDKVAAYLCNKP